MNFTRFPLIFILVIQYLLLACQKAVPDIQQLRTLSGFRLDQDTATVDQKLSPVFNVSGTCAAQFEDIEVSVNAGQSWQKISDLAIQQNVSCSTSGVFQARFDFSKSPLDAKLWSDLGSFDSLFFRANSAAGYSDPQKLRLETAPLKAPHAFVSVGSSRSSISGGYQLVDRFFHVNSTVQVSSGYKLEGALTW